MTYGTPFPDRTYEGGVLPVNADRIEKRLSEIWSLATHSGDDGGNLVKICLANIVVICDGLTRPEAELLAVAIAREYPSRVILTVIDEDLKSYYSFVRTSCTRDPDSGVIRCWEIIELVSEQAKLHSVVSALRSLLVDSVPVVTVDFRPYHSTPELDETLASLTDLALANTEVVPTGLVEKPYLSLRWYRTLPIRLLVGDLFSVTNLNAPIGRLTVYSEKGKDLCDDLLAGWLVRRLRGKAGDHNRPTVPGVPTDAMVESRERSAGDRTVVSVELVGADEPIRIVEQDTPDGRIYRLEVMGQMLSRSPREWPLATYIVGVLMDSSESREYADVVETIAHMRHPTAGEKAGR